MLVIILVLSNLLYMLFEQKGLKMINEYNMKSLSQISVNINYMNGIIKNFCSTTFRQSEVQHLMFNSENEFSLSVDTIKSINELGRAVSSNAMIDSISVYNNANKNFYSSANWSTESDKQLSDMVTGKQAAPILYPIPRLLTSNISKDVTDRKVITYILYDSKNEDASIDSALIVNVKTDWLFQNIKMLGDDNDNLILLDKSGNIIGDKNGEFKMFDKLAEGYTNKIELNNENGNSFITNINGQKRVITYLVIPSTQWILIDDQPYNKVFEFIHDIKNQTILITLGLLIFAIIGAALISKVLYKPFSILLEQVKDSFKDAAFTLRKEDDTKYLSEVFNQSINRVKDLEKYCKSTRSVLKENALKTLLIEGTTIINQINEENFPEGHNFFNTSSKFKIILLKIDNYSMLCEKDSELRKVLRFTISNKASEIISTFCRNEIILIGVGECVVLIDVDSIQENNQMKIIKEKLEEVQVDFKEITKFSVSAFISDTVNNIDMLNQEYKELQNLSRYTLVYGQNCILQKSEISSMNSSVNFDYPERLENKIIDGIKLGNLEAVKKEFDLFITTISKMGIDNFMLFLTRFVLSLNGAVNSLNINRVNEINIDFNEFYSKLNRIETCEILKTEFIYLFEDIIEQQAVKTEQRHSTIINSVMDYIRKEYKNKDLCLKVIADQFNLSTMYLGLIFKDFTKKSVQEFINEVRLDKASELLKRTEYSVNEIMNSTGFDSVSNFYKLYKKYYGTTPKEYRLNVGLTEKSKSDIN